MARTTRIALIVTIFAALLVAGVAIGVAVADESDDDVYAVDTSHGLDNSGALSEFDVDGAATGEVDGLDAELTVAERREYVDDNVDMLHAADLRQDYLRIQYNEETTRTLRILIPAAMVTPYDRDSVDSVAWSDGAVADLAKAREGEYLEVVITVRGESNIVLPLSQHAQYTSGWIGDQRERADAANPFTEGEPWTYVSGDELENGSVSFEVEDPDNAVVQHDYKEDGEAWVPTPADGVDEDGVYYYVDRHDDGDSYVIRIVSHDEDPPAVRYKADAEPTDRVTGWVNDAQRIPERIGELLPEDAFPWS